MSDTNPETLTPGNFSILNLSPDDLKRQFAPFTTKLLNLGYAGLLLQDILEDRYHNGSSDTLLQLPNPIFHNMNVFPQIPQYIPEITPIPFLENVDTNLPSHCNDVHQYDELIASNHPSGFQEDSNSTTPVQQQTVVDHNNSSRFNSSGVHPELRKLNGIIDQYDVIKNELPEVMILLHCIYKTISKIYIQSIGIHEVKH